MITPGDGSSLLRLAGTSSHYQGLFQSVARAELFSDNTLDEAADDFPESVDVPPLAQAMVSMEQVFDRLKELDRQGWKHLANHPDIDAAHEALMLREHLTELLRTDEVKSQPDGFIEVLRSSEAAASKLESSLAAWRQHSDGTDDASPSPGDLATVRQSLQKIGSDCTACHRAYRDVPKGRPAQHEAFRSAS